ncbi:MAG: hypothetical protein IPN08_12055 [Bacteroidales bacterium]|jgi:hypothetical protein|nr:hypothetical protein [Bacteroidales bacterium]MBK9358108.1 hypothetical protein [Bacteroidales bacterium]
MKKGLILILLAAAAVTFNGQAQCVNGTKSYPIYKTGAALVDQMDSDGREIVRIEYDLVFDSKESFRNLSSDWEYTIVAFADDGVEDLDVKAYSYDELLDKWTLVSEDKSTESYAIVTVKPTETVLYKIEVIVYKFKEGYTAARYGLMYVHD